MEQYNAINNMDAVLEFYDNIGNKKQFNVLYTMYLNLLESHKLVNYRSNMIYDTELCSTLTMSLIACLKTFSYTNNKKMLVMEYIKNVINMINTTNYEPRDYSSLTEWFSRLFNNTPLSGSVVSRSIYAFSDEDTYYEAQEKMYKLLMNHPNIMYRDDTINVLTLGYFAFLMVVRSMSGGETQKYLINDYLKTLVRIIKYHETHSVFDEPDRASMEFDFTRSD